MTSKQLVQLTDILYSALGEPIGLLLRCSDAALVRQKLYVARQKAQDPALQALQFRLVDLPDGDLIVIKAEVQVSKQSAKVLGL